MKKKCTKKLAKQVNTTQESMPFSLSLTANDGVALGLSNENER
jgi:hypothetical protein